MSYTVYIMKRSKEAGRSRRTRSEAARVVREDWLKTPAEDPLAAAHRQSLLASRQDADAETLAFIESVADDRGWT